MEFEGLTLPLREILDIGIVALIYYYLILLVRGTRAVAVIYGLVLVLFVFHLSDVFGLYTLNWLLTNFLGSIFLVVIILFQSDIKKALAQVGAGPFWRKPDLREETLEQLVQSVMTMSRIKMGAIIVLERTMPLGDIVERGVEVDSRLSKELLLTIFHYDTPLHDGAVIVRKGRLAAAACILPLSSKFKGQTVFGTRHRAALGISEESDAVTVVVSEERGAVSVAIGGRLTTSLDEVRLRRVLKTVLER
ncbi:diadenylate cyclase CdaA [Desulfovibrio aminophilus]|nr:diadenylate cyclase CdaA [Desulfovibrio aminophilus]MCM0754253.1 diadenylate cyclase CdaA [Desulfovibrio aminophilus]